MALQVADIKSGNNPDPIISQRHTITELMFAIMDLIILLWLYLPVSENGRGQ